MTDREATIKQNSPFVQVQNMRLLPVRCHVQCGVLMNMCVLNRQPKKEAVTSMLSGLLTKGVADKTLGEVVAEVVCFLCSWVSLWLWVGAIVVFVVCGGGSGGSGDILESNRGN